MHADSLSVSSEMNNIFSFWFPGMTIAIAALDIGKDPVVRLLIT